MSATTADGIESGDTVSAASLADLDDLYDLLSNRRRRYVVHYLQYHDAPVSLGTLAERVAAWEHGISPAAVTSAQRKVTYTALQQRHLPRLAAVGVVQFDRRQGVVSPAPALSDLAVYTEVVPRGELPWSHVYLALSVVLAAILAVTRLGLAPFAWLSPFVWAAVFVVCVGVTAVVHALDTRRTRLGQSPLSPDVRE